MTSPLYGVTVGSIFYFQKSSFTWANSTPLPSIVFAFTKAVIDNCYLSWLDVNKLQAAFPNRVQVLGDTVTLTGPVTIVSHNIGPLQRIYMQSAIAFAAVTVSFLVTFIFTSIFFPEPPNYRTRSSNDEIQITPRVIALAAVNLAVFVAAFYAAGRLIPTQAGIYFGKEVPFYA